MSSRKKILQLSHDYAGPFVPVCREFVDSLPQCDVTTVYLQGAPDPLVSERTGGNKVIYLGDGLTNLRGFKFKSLVRLYQLLRDESFDAVIAHRYKGIYLAGVMSFLFNLGPIFGVVHEHQVFRRKTRALFLTFWRRSIHILAVSQSVRDNVLASCPQLDAQERVHVLPHGIDLAREQELVPRAAARRQLGLPEDALIFGAVGRLVDKKNFALLLDGFARLDDKTCHLVLVGSGPLAGELNAQAEGLGLERRVHFAGHVDRAFRIYRAFDVFVMTSDNREAFGIVLLEAMLARVPVVCSDAPGPLEVISDTGLTFKAKDAQGLADCLVLMQDKARREQMAEKAFKRLSEHYSMRTFTNNLTQLPAWRGVLWQ